MTREKLYEDHTGLPTACVRKFTGGFLDEDLLSVASLAMWTATENFDPDKAKFTTYAWSMMIGAMKRELRDRGESIRTPGYRQEKGEHAEQPVYLEELSTSDGENRSWESFIPHGSEDTHPQLLRDFLRRKCRGHRAAEYILLLADGYSLKDIADMEGGGLSPQSISNHIRRFRDRLRHDPEVCEFFGVKPPWEEE